MTRAADDDTVVIAGPGWFREVVDPQATYTTDDDKMRLAIELSRQNVLRGSGGPFGAAIFERPSGRLISVGANSVVRLNNCVLHAEIFAIMAAQKRVGSYTLAGSADVSYELASSCDPCAMCLGALLWSGLCRVMTGAARRDAAALNFDEGPVFPESYTYLEARGIDIVRGVLREEAAAVLELYRRKGGPIY